MRVELVSLDGRSVALVDLPDNPDGMFGVISFQRRAFIPQRTPPREDRIFQYQEVSLFVCERNPACVLTGSVGR